jgi:endonuclease/exonuclease/phosphatase family metal-dependent hydrolase
VALRIISLNVWGGKLHAPLMRYLAETDADVLCLQEVVRAPDVDAGWLLYRDHGVELPQRANLFDEICAALPNHDGFFSPVARGMLFHGTELVPAEFGLATFVRKRHPVIGQLSAFVHGVYSPDGWGEHPRSRNAHCLRLFNHAGGYAFTIAQMHGLRDLAGKGDTPARAAQAKSLAELVEQVRVPGERLVVCGDFNVLPDSVTFAELGRLGLADLVTTRGFSDTRTSHYAKDGRYADYMLVNAEVGVIDFDVVAAPEVSDHRALRLDIA